LSISSALVTRHRSPRRPLLFRSSTVTHQGLALLQAGLLLATVSAGYIPHPSGTRSLVPETAGGKHATQLQCWGPIKVAIWVGVSFFYVLFSCVTAHDVSAGRRNGVGSAPVGILLMWPPLPRGFAIGRIRVQETKSSASAIGSLQRSALPNYLAKWCSGLVSGFGHVTYRLFRLGLGSLGLLFIVLVMVGASRRLELKQSKPTPPTPL